MPRLTDARKELRCTQIVEAAARCFGRNGVERTSIADITAECGLSTGSIYAHYRNKAELVQATARAVLARRAEIFAGYAASDTPPDPDGLLTRLTADLDPVTARVGVQLWAEATIDPAVRDIIRAVSDRMQAILHDCVTAWLVKVEGRDPADAAERATPIVDQLQARYQAELLDTALRAPARASHTGTGASDPTTPAADGATG